MTNAVRHNTRAIDGSYDPIALTNIYDATTNIAIWNRSLDNSLIHFSQTLCGQCKSYQTRISGSLTSIKHHLENDLPEINHKSCFVDDVVLLVDMFSELLDLNAVGLRLAVLSNAMCPKFHVDRVPARLITTYFGEGTEWVPGHYVKRDEQGRVEVVGAALIESLSCGQVALMKGETWEGNEGKGLVHRSPMAAPSLPRLVLTLDCVG